jgi:hypothetical protein
MATVKKKKALYTKNTNKKNVEKTLLLELGLLGKCNYKNRYLNRPKIFQKKVRKRHILRNIRYQ